MDYLKEQLINESITSLEKEAKEKRKVRNKRKAARRKARLEKK